MMMTEPATQPVLQILLSCSLMLRSTRSGRRKAACFRCLFGANVTRSINERNLRAEDEQRNDEVVKASLSYSGAPIQYLGRKLRQAQISVLCSDSFQNEVPEASLDSRINAKYIFMFGRSF